MSSCREIRPWKAKKQSDNHIHIYGNCNSVSGLFIAPDDYMGDADDLSKAIKDWESAQQSGIVFLPGAGNRLYGHVVSFIDNGYYWSSSTYEETTAHHVYFGNNFVEYRNIGNRSDGYSVRLITESKQ